jgi:protein-S-isoprenylcysteine O-methyltransferase Ste14
MWLTPIIADCCMAFAAQKREADMSTSLVDQFHWPMALAIWPQPYVIPFLLIYVWTRRVERNKRQRTARHDAYDFDRRSWLFIDYGSKVARLVALVAAIVTPPWTSGSAQLLMYATGLVAMAAGTFLRRRCFVTLGEDFTFSVKVSAAQPIVQTGAYRWVRHPSYTGGLLYNIGIGLVLTNLLSTIVLTLTMSAVYAFRVMVEEKALLKLHGERYRQYMRSTKRFVPFLF